MPDEALLLSCSKEPCVHPCRDVLQQASSAQTAQIPRLYHPALLMAVTLSHLSLQEDFANACQGICTYKGLAKC